MRRLVYIVSCRTRSLSLMPSRLPPLHFLSVPEILRPFSSHSYRMRQPVKEKTLSSLRHLLYMDDVDVVYKKENIDLHLWWASISMGPSLTVSLRIVCLSSLNAKE